MNTIGGIRLKVIENRLPIYVAVAATLLIYSLGLAGPFILDDAYNLAPVETWLQGQASWLEVMLGNDAGILGRPVAMLSFLVTAAIGGFSPYHFKLGNLIIHIVCGLVAWKLLARLLARDPVLARNAGIVAGVLAGLWLLHPINVSTVLYPVQRMAQLSALLVLASLWTYVRARQQLEQGQYRAARIKLFALFPLLFAAGLFSKENAAVAPALCLVLELAYFRGWQRGTGMLKTFYGVFLLAPALAGIALLLVAPGKLFGLYATRDFTMWERLLSQSRALVEYIGLLLVPRGSQMGVLFDDFQISTGLLSPPATLLSLIVLAAVSVFAVVARKRAPSVFAGWFFFLVAHGIESTVFPLELYFEHRNYLPGIGLLLAAGGLCALVLSRRPVGTSRSTKAAVAVLALIAASFAAVTMSQTRAWRSMDTLVEQTLAHRPGSMRAIEEYAGQAIRARRYDAAITALQRLVDSDDRRQRVMGHLSLITVDCLRGTPADPAHLTAAVTEAPRKITIGELEGYRRISKVLAKDPGPGAQQPCGDAIDASTVADAVLMTLDAAAEQPERAKPKWLLRVVAAELLISAERWPAALYQAELAWEAGGDPAVGALLARIYLVKGDLEAAERVVDQVAQQVAPYERSAQATLVHLRSEIARRRSH
ncbi:hypothetical protein [Lysobacter sp. D1-1-M9]|uniref:hypothetical protein n=1 Tax=Novilysobacter longmucuonensis TaxID=3098603 RepID=UPI002FCA6462